MLNYTNLSDEAKAELTCVYVEAVTLFFLVLGIVGNCCYCCLYWKFTGTFPAREDFLERVQQLRGRRRRRIASTSPDRLSIPPEPPVPPPPNNSLELPTYKQE